MQLMACLDMKIGQFERSGPTDAQGSLIEEMRELVTETQQAIRSISYLTHPPLLDKLTLPEALKELVEGFGRRTGLDVKFERIGDAQLSCPAAEGAAYRIVQEALSNVHRHAKARGVSVRLSRGRSFTHVIIVDDGIGLPDDVSSGVGLAGMRSRLSELGGRLSILSRSQELRSSPASPQKGRNARACEDRLRGHSRRGIDEQKQQRVWQKLWHFSEHCERYPTRNFVTRTDRPPDDKLCARCNSSA